MVRETCIFCQGISQSNLYKAVQKVASRLNHRAGTDIDLKLPMR